jgi:hypothetical protein
MEKEFISYQLSLRMKALQFDYDCFAFYQIEYHEDRPIMVDDDDQYRVSGLRTCKNSEIPEHYVAAPLYQQAFRWFRKEYPDLDFGVAKIHNGTNNYHYHINLEWEFFEGIYEEAELHCLTKLIEGVEK